MPKKQAERTTVDSEGVVLEEDKMNNGTKAWLLDKGFVANSTMLQEKERFLEMAR